MSPLRGVPPGPKMSKFHAVFRKFWQNHMLAPHSPEELPPILEIRDPSLPPPMIVHTNHAWKTMICMSSAPAKFLPSAMKLRRLCFYTCLSVDRGRSASLHAGIPPPWEQTPPSIRLLLQMVRILLVATPTPETHIGIDSSLLFVYILS